MFPRFKKQTAFNATQPTHCQVLISIAIIAKLSFLINKSLLPSVIEALNQYKENGYVQKLKADITLHSMHSDPKQDLLMLLYRQTVPTHIDEQPEHKQPVKPTTGEEPASPSLPPSSPRATSTMSKTRSLKCKVMPKSVSDPGPYTAPGIASAQLEELTNKVLSPLSDSLDHYAEKFALSASRALFSTMQECIDIILDVVDKKMAALEDNDDGDESEVEPRESVESKGLKGKGKGKESESE